MTPHEKIRLLRREKNYSQEYMAMKLGNSQPTYSKIELGQIKLTEEMKQDILGILETTTVDFDNMERPTTFNFHQESGEIAGQAINSNKVEDIMKIIDKAVEPYLGQIDQLKSENAFLRNLLGRKN